MYELGVLGIIAYSLLLLFSLVTLISVCVSFSKKEVKNKEDIKEILSCVGFCVLGAFLTGLSIYITYEGKEENRMLKQEAQEIYNAMDYFVEYDTEFNDTVISVGTECQKLGDGKYCKVPMFEGDLKEFSEVDTYTEENIIEFKEYEVIPVNNYWKKQ